jgi:hypothetical protein
MKKSLRNPITINLDQEDCLEIINLLGIYGRNKGQEWDTWAGQISQTIQSSLNNSPVTPRIPVILDEQNWNMINKIIQSSSADMDNKKQQWAQKIGLLLNGAIQKVEAPPPLPATSPTQIGKNATIVEQKAIVYKEMNTNTPPLMELPVLSEITLLANYRQGDKHWTRITLPDGREGYVPGTTKIYKIKEAVILEKNGTDVYNAPSAESLLERHLDKGSLIYILGPVQPGSATWVKIRDLSGKEGFIPGNIRIQFRQSA